MTLTQSPSDAERVKSALIALSPDAMRETFAPMVDFAISTLPAETVSTLANDLQSAIGENGEPNMAALIAVGKRFGLTDEMIEGYQAAAQP